MTTAVLSELLFQHGVMTVTLAHPSSGRLVAIQLDPTDAPAVADLWERFTVAAVAAAQGVMLDMCDGRVPDAVPVVVHPCRICGEAVKESDPNARFSGATGNGRPSWYCPAHA